ncbi:MAG TPA: VWA domain-containing protein [Chloroflexia bacterium]|nr:VWA domain-containing protein [Chloroflexia bacterium]
MNNVVLLRPDLLWFGLLILPLLALATGRLRGLARWRRRAALLLQALSAALMLLALAEPALSKANDSLDLVLVLDSSPSLSTTARQQAAAFAQGVLQKAGPTDRVRAISAGANAVLLTNDAVKDGSWTAQTDREPNRTDLAAGLRLAGSLLSSEGKRRVVVVSDGWETQGSASDEAARLRARGVSVDVVGLGALGDKEIIVRGLTTPPYARQGDSVQSDLRVFSTADTAATISVRVDGSAPSTRQIALKKGENSIPIEQKAEAQGFHRIEVTLEGQGDTVKENNSAASTLVVKPQPRVLVLEDRVGEADSLAAALASSQVYVDVRSAAAVPSRLNDLSDYDSIVLNNVAATSFTLDQQRTLQEYVRRMGRGLVAVGGQTSFAKGGYMDSALEEMLPVSSKPAPRPEKGETAMILVMDRSFSMDEYRGSREQSKFSMAKQAARLAVDALRDDDTLGVLTFDTETQWAVPVQKIRGEADKEAIKQTIVNVELGGGTSIFPAVQEAYDAMSKVQVPARHIVLLTDGREFNTPYYEPLIAQIRSAGITLSTIGIGEDVDKDLLTRLAKLGEGRYYFTERLENIPKIVFKELDLALKQAVIEGSVQPRIQSPSPILRGFSPQDVPQLGGYEITTPKEEAVVGLVADLPHPLLAHWNYGLGRVVAFTSDASKDWASRWLTWASFARFWDNAVRWSMASPVDRRLQPSVRLPGPEEDVPARSAIIDVESLNSDNSFADLADVTAGVRDASGKVTTVELSQVAPGRYEAVVPAEQPGTYEVLVTRKQGDETLTETTGFAVPSDAEFQQAGTNERLLKELSGGRDYLTQPEAALDRSALAGLAPDYEPLWHYALAPGLILLLLSVAVRRIDFLGRRRAPGQQAAG